MRLVFYVNIYERTVFVGTIQSYKSDVQGRGVIIPNLPCETARGYYLHDFSLSHWKLKMILILVYIFFCSRALNSSSNIKRSGNNWSLTKACSEPSLMYSTFVIIMCYVHTIHPLSICAKATVLMLFLSPSVWRTLKVFTIEHCYVIIRKLRPRAF